MRDLRNPFLDDIRFVFPAIEKKESNLFFVF